MNYSVSVVSGVISRGFKKTVLPVSSVELQKVAGNHNINKIWIHKEQK